jgi:hypothetical protein
MTAKITALALVFMATTAQAQGMGGMEMPAAACTAMVAPPSALAGWSAKTPVTSADKSDGLAAAAIKPGKSVLVALHPTREVGYVMQPEKPGGSVAKGGLLALDVADAGTYQVSLDSGAWLDVLKDGAPAMSSAHAPGPACTGIKKTVQFPLQPGRYVIQISANADPNIQVLVSKVP